MLRATQPNSSQWRYGLHLLVHAFKRDVDDPDRPSFHESHVKFYISKYLGRSWDSDWTLMDLKTFGDLVAMIKECVDLDPATSFVKAVLHHFDTLNIRKQNWTNIPTYK